MQTCSPSSAHRSPRGRYLSTSWARFPQLRFPETKASSGAIEGALCEARSSEHDGFVGACLRCAAQTVRRTKILVKLSASRWRSATSESFLHSVTALGVLRNREKFYGDAERLLKRVLSLQEDKLGPNHPDVAEGLQSLSKVYCNQGRQTEAKAALTRALAIRDITLGPEHPLTKSTRKMLATLDAGSAHFRV